MNKFPTMVVERLQVMDELAEEIIETITKKYEVSTLDFVQILEHTQKRGLANTRL